MKHKGGMFYAILAIATTGLLTWGFCVHALTNNDLVISQVQITGGAGKTSQDYISIYNKSDAVIDLNGLRLVKRTKTGTTDTTIKSWISPTLLNPGAYHLWANSTDGFSSSINANSESTQTISDDNGIAIREGAENTGTIIDSFAWGAANNIFVETSPYPTNHLGGQYYSRINNQDSNNNSLDFQILDHLITPVCGNNIIEAGETCDDGNIISGDGCSSSCQAETSQAICGNSILESGETCDDGNTISGDGCSSLCQIENPTSILGDVRINELVSDPASGDEWLELYNTTTKDIDLTSWTVEDGSATKTTLTGTIGHDTTNKFFVITKPHGALNNSGDIVNLKNADGDLIDSITYGDWDDGDVTNNAPVATKPNSLARVHDGESTSNDSVDFKVTTTPTKGTANIITEPNEDNGDENNNTTDGYDYSQDIIISEIFPNPIGLDSEAVNGEFIELYNKGQKNVLLTGWRLESSGLVMEIPLNTTVYAGQYLTLITKNILPLLNDGATVKLFQPERVTSYQSVTYKKALEGQSYANFLTGGWQWTSKPTPGAINVLVQAPKVSFDLIDDPIVNQTIRFDSSDSLLANKTATYSWNFGDKQTSNLANPVHTFVTNGKYPVSLTVKTDYGTGTISKTITVLTAANTDETATEITASSTNKIIITDLMANPLGSDEGKEWLKLKNSSAEAVDLQGFKIINAAGKAIGNFKQSFIINPGEEKIVDNKILSATLGNSEQTISLLDQNNKLISSLSYEKTVEGKSYLESQTNTDTTATASSTPTNNSIFTTAGTAICAPGLFGSQYFYFLPEFGEPLYEVYNSKKLFPKIKAGDQLIITGEYSELENGPRLKTKEAKDIQIIGSDEIQEPAVSKSSDLKLPPYPRLALVQGEVVSKKSPRVYLADEQGEMEIYLSTGSNLKVGDFTVGDKLTVFGVLTTLNNAARLEPRSRADIKSSTVNDLSAASITDPTTTTNIDLTNTETTANKTTMFYYLIAGGVILIGAAIYFIYKNK